MMPCQAVASAGGWGGQGSKGKGEGNAQEKGEIGSKKEGGAGRGAGPWGSKGTFQSKSCAPEPLVLRCLMVHRALASADTSTYALCYRLEDGARPSPLTPPPQCPPCWWASPDLGECQAEKTNPGWMPEDRGPSPSLSVSCHETLGLSLPVSETQFTPIKPGQ